MTKNEIPFHPYTAEAIDIGTATERLAELAREKTLLATNPSTPATILEVLSKAKNALIRQAVACNPNTPVPILLSLAEEFPQEFLANPIIPLLSLSQPDFIKPARFRAWQALLSCEHIPLLWLQWLQQGSVKYPVNKRLLMPELEAHVTMAGEITEPWETHIEAALEQYKQASLVSSSSSFSAFNNMTTMSFLLALPHLALRALDSLVAKAKGTNWYNPQKKLILAGFPEMMTAETLTRLSQCQLVSIQRAVAGHARTPDEVLGQLATAAPVVRRAVANNPHVPHALLQVLAHDEHTDVRRTVAHSHRTPLVILETLALDPEPSVREAVAKHQTLNDQVSWRLAHDTTPSVRAALACNVHAPQAVLIRLTDDHEQEVRVAVARNPRLPSESFLVLVKDTIGAVRASLAGNPQLTPDSLEELAQDPFPDVRKHLAGNPRASLSLLYLLMQEGGMEDWERIARNPHATPELLSRLAQQGNSRVRKAVAAHKRTPGETLKWIADQDNQDEDYDNRRKLASNPHTPISVLAEELIIDRRLRYHHCSELSLRVAHNLAMKHAPHSLLLASLAENLRADSLMDRPSWFRPMLVTDPDLPPLLLDVFANSPLWEERYLAAQHPAISRVRLQQLAHDGNRYVRATAQAALTGYAEQGSSQNI